MLNPYLMVAEVLKPQGVRGEVKLRPVTNDIGRFSALKTVYLEDRGAYTPVSFKAARMDEEFVYAYVGGASDRDAAEALRGRFLYVDRDNAVALDEDEEFICDLIGCEAADDSGRVIGKLTDVMQPGGNDVYVFEGPLGEVLVPALKRVFLDVNTAEKKMLLSRKALDEVAVFDED